MVTKFNHSKLLGRIKEFGFTQEELAKAIDMNPGTLCLKLKNRSRFSTDEMCSICRILEIPTEEIGAYFFTT